MLVDDVRYCGCAVQCCAMLDDADALQVLCDADVVQPCARYVDGGLMERSREWDTRRNHQWSMEAQ